MPSSTSTSTSTSTPTTSPPALHAPRQLTLHAAQLALRACQSAAQHHKTPMNIAVLDASLHLLAFARMPGAKLTSISISIDKAFTAAGHRNPTHIYKEKVWPGGPMYGIENSNGGRFMLIGGGLPVEVEGEVVGAIGCSSGTPDEDRRVAEVGVKAILEYIGQQKEGGGVLKAKL